MAERLPVEDFHGARAQEYTEQCVEDLVNSQQFKAYVRHVKYSERLYLTWLIVPIGIASVVAYHLYFFNADYFLNMADEASFRSMTIQAIFVPSIPYVAIFLSLYLFPCTLVAPFVGFYQEPTSSDSFLCYLFLTAVNCGLGLLSGGWFYHLSFLSNDLTLAWRLPQAPNGSCSSALKCILSRAVPLQGYLTASYLVARWRRTFWARLWHIPFPLILIPLFVGVFGVFWWQFTMSFNQYLLDDKGAPTHAGAYLYESATTETYEALLLLKTILKEVLVTMMHDLQSYTFSGKLPSMFFDSITSLKVYLAFFWATLIYFVTILMKPVLGELLNATFYLFPTDPSLWGLALFSASVGLLYLLNMDEVPLGYVTGFLYVIAGLLYNGFVA